MPNRSLAALFALALLPLVCVAAQVPSVSASSAPKTRVVILGTGTPVADPDASGPAVAIVKRTPCSTKVRKTSRTA